MRVSQFRETLWFKKGVEDSEPAPEAEEPAESARDLPIEDRYIDDGSVTREDSQLFSLRTGQTQHVPRVHGAPVRPSMDRMPMLVRELRAGRVKTLVWIGLALVVACALAAAFV